MEQGKAPALSVAGRWLGAAQEAVSRASLLVIAGTVAQTSLLCLFQGLSADEMNQIPWANI